MLAERQAGGTPWHAHHIAERHSLFAIIALGEGVVGTVAALSAVVDRQGWTLEAALVGIAGMGLTFGMWWAYYLVPSGEIGTAGAVALTLVAALSGVNVATCLVILMLAPTVTVVGCEARVSPP